MKSIRMPRALVATCALLFSSVFGACESSQAQPSASPSAASCEGPCRQTAATSRPEPHQSEHLPFIDVPRLRERFNADVERVRLVSLLSPTCRYCIVGHEAIAAGLSDNQGPISAFLVWLPMLDGDSPREAARRAQQLQDNRVYNAWDGPRAVGDHFARALGLERTAWDVYLVYEPGVRWTADLAPRPTFWMHQLPYAPQTRRLDAKRLSVELEQALEKSRRARGQERQEVVQ